MKAIQDIKKFANNLKLEQLLEQYYLISWKKYPKEKNI